MSVDEASAVAIEDESGRTHTFLIVEQLDRICERVVQPNAHDVNARQKIEPRRKRIRGAFFSIDAPLIGGNQSPVTRAAIHRTEYSSATGAERPRACGKARQQGRPFPQIGVCCRLSEGQEINPLRGHVWQRKAEEMFDRERCWFRSPVEPLEWLCVSRRRPRWPIRKSPPTISSARSGWIPIDLWPIAARGAVKTSTSLNVGCVTTNTPRARPC